VRGEDKTKARGKLEWCYAGAAGARTSLGRWRKRVPFEDTRPCLRAQGHDPKTNQKENPIEYVKSLPAGAFEVGAGAVDC
jgi:hypothetical protein